MNRSGRPVPLRARRRQRRQRMADLQGGQAHPETGEARELGRPSGRPRSPRRRRPVPRESRKSPTSARRTRTAPHPVVSAGVARSARGSPPVRRSTVGTRRGGRGSRSARRGSFRPSAEGGRSLRPPLPDGSCPGLLCRVLRRGQSAIEPLAQDVGRRSARLPGDHLTSAEHEQGGTACTSKRSDSPGALSTSTLTNFSCPARSCASRARTGLTWRHGAHHTAQRSTSTASRPAGLSLRNQHPRRQRSRAGARGISHISVCPGRNRKPVLLAAVLADHGRCSHAAARLSPAV